MKFEVQKTSEWGSGKPCEGAVRSTTVDGVWNIKFLTLKDLMDFVKKHKTVVLDENVIEIYDDYRE